MPWVTFKAWDERIAADHIRERNAQARAEWRARIDEMKGRGG
jgi:hypothetical protein